jgi:predicted ArsR family transcriptional regulator
MAISSTNSSTNIGSKPNEFWNQNFFREKIPTERRSKKQAQLEKDIVNFLVLTGNCGKTRNEIVTYLNIPRTTIYDSLNRMNRKDKIEIDYKLSRKGKGRPETIFFLKGFKQGTHR